MEPLTPREKAVFDLLRLGLSNKEIAARLGIGLDTARRHTSRVRRKCDIPSVAALALLDIPEQADWLTSLNLGEIRLSKAEIRVLLLVCRGYGSKHIARILQVSPRTVDKHRENLLRKCRLQSTRQLSAWLRSQYAKCGIENSSEDS